MHCATKLHDEYIHILSSTSSHFYLMSLRLNMLTICFLLFSQFLLIIICLVIIDKSFKDYINTNSIDCNDCAWRDSLPFATLFLLYKWRKKCIKHYILVTIVMIFYTWFSLITGENNHFSMKVNSYYVNICLMNLLVIHNKWCIFKFQWIWLFEDFSIYPIWFKYMEMCLQHVHNGIGFEISQFNKIYS